MKKQLNRLAEVFKEKGVSNRLIARQLNKTEETVSRWVNNHRQPSVGDLARLAEFLHVDIRSLFIPTKLDFTQEPPYIYAKKALEKKKRSGTDAS